MLKIKITSFFFYVSLCTALINQLSSINCEIVTFRSTALVEVTFCDKKKFNSRSNNRILAVTINHTKNN